MKLFERTKHDHKCDILIKTSHRRFGRSQPGISGNSPYSRKEYFQVGTEEI